MEKENILLYGHVVLKCVVNMHVLEYISMIKIERSTHIMQVKYTGERNAYLYFFLYLIFTDELGK